jgi:hypothetical protein
MCVFSELAFQIHEVFEALGSSIGLKSVCIVGGVDMMTQVGYWGGPKGGDGPLGIIMPLYVSLSVYIGDRLWC